MTSTISAIDYSSFCKDQQNLSDQLSAFKTYKSRGYFSSFCKITVDAASQFADRFDSIAASSDRALALHLRRKRDAEWLIKEKNESYATACKTHRVALLLLTLHIAAGIALTGLGALLFSLSLPAASLFHAGIALISLGALVASVASLILLSHCRTFAALKKKLSQEIETLHNNAANANQSIQEAGKKRLEDIENLGQEGMEAMSRINLECLNRFLSAAHFFQPALEHNLEPFHKKSFASSAKYASSLEGKRGGQRISLADYAQKHLDIVLRHFHNLKRLNMPSLEIETERDLRALPPTLESLTIRAIAPDALPHLHKQCPHLQQVILESQKLPLHKANLLHKTPKDLPGVDIREYAIEIAPQINR